MPSKGELTTESYWDSMWQRSALPAALDPDRTDVAHYPDRKHHEFFLRWLGPGEGRRLLEVGCGRSPFLPYFAKRLRYAVSGLDYSPTGCEQSRAILARDGVCGEVFCADLFAAPAGLQGSFEVVASFGVVEHFEETARCIRTLAEFLVPGGLLLTIIPNLIGLNGFLQRTLDRSVYDLHVPMTPAQLADVHRAAGLSVESCEFVMSCDLRVPDISAWRRRRLRKLVNFSQTRLTRLVWNLDPVLGIKPGAWLSPFIFCVARKA